MNATERVSMSYEGGVDLLAMWRVLWAHKLLIIVCAVILAAIAAVLAFQATPMYRAEVAITEVTDAGMSGGLASQLSGIASLAGVNLGGATGPRAEAQAVLRSGRLIEEFIKRKNLTEQLFPDGEKRTLWFAVRRFRINVLSIHEDKIKGVTTVGIEWTDPAIAAGWANDFVGLANELIRARALADSTRNIAYLNEQIQRTNKVELLRVMYNLVESETKTQMLANARADYAFTVVDPAVPPEMRVSPKRVLMVLFGAVLGGVIGVIIAFIHETVVRHRGSATRA
jgi:uncharacterized protein involved in exopolysaccharide biosynthesis